MSVQFDVCKIGRQGSLFQTHPAKAKFGNDSSPLPCLYTPLLDRHGPALGRELIELKLSLMSDSEWQCRIPCDELECTAKQLVRRYCLPLRDVAPANVESESFLLVLLQNFLRKSSSYSQNARIRSERHLWLLTVYQCNEKVRRTKFGLTGDERRQSRDPTVTNPYFGRIYFF